MSATHLKLDAMIRARTEPELKAKLEALARSKRKKFAVFIREELWAIVNADPVSAIGGKRAR